MPTSTPILDYSQIRNYAERFTWLDPLTRQQQTGYNPPLNAIDKHPMPFTVTFLTEDGVPYRGRAVCIGVNTKCRSRRIQFIDDAVIALPIPESERTMMKSIKRGDIRQVSDILIVEIDGVRFSAH